MDDKTKSIPIPMIRRVNPSILAQEIIGVQPMAGPAGSIFGSSSNVEFKVFDDEQGYHVTIQITGLFGIHDKLIEINKYIKETFADRCKLTETNLHYVFDNEKDRTMFLLRWSQ